MSRSPAHRTACLALAIAAAAAARAQVVINEFVYDTPGTPFVELYNAGAGPIDISGWHIVTFPWTFAITTVPGGTVLPTGGFWQVNPGTLATGAGAIVLWDAAWTILDQVAYEDVGAVLGIGNVGEGNYIHGEHRSAAAPFATSWSRQRDGQDTNNNARDFRVMPATPGGTNNRPPVLPWANDFDALAPGTIVPGWGSTVAAPQVVDVTVVGPLNPRPLPPSPHPVPNVRAASFSQPAGTIGGRSWMLLDEPRDSVSFSACVWLDATVTGRANAWSIGVRGTTGSGYAAPDPDGLSPGNENGNTGVSWTFRVSPAGAKLWLLDHGDGGREPVVLASIPIVAGVNDGWRRLRLDVYDDTCYATFDGVPYQAHVHPGLGNVYVGARNDVASALASGGLIVDDVDVRMKTSTPDNPLGCVGDCPPRNGDARLLTIKPKKPPDGNGNYAVLIPVAPGVSISFTAVCMLTSRLVAAPVTQVSYYSADNSTPPRPTTSIAGPFTLASGKSGPDWWAASHANRTITGPFFVVLHYDSGLRAPFAATYADNDGTTHAPQRFPYWFSTTGTQGSWTERKDDDAQPWAIKFACTSRAGAVMVDVVGTPEPGSVLTLSGICLKPLDWSVGILSFTPIPPVDLGFLGLPGCYQSVDLAVAATFLALTDPMGVAGLPLPIPLTPVLSGVQLHTQWVGPSPGVNALGMVVSPRTSFQVQ